MVAGTASAKVLRVEYEQNCSELSKTGIACFLHVRPNGVKILYSHHLLYSRQIPKGPWDKPQLVRMSLSPSIVISITVNVFKELLDTLVDQSDLVEVMQGEIGSDPAQELEGNE